MNKDGKEAKQWFAPKLDAGSATTTTTTTTAPAPAAMMEVIFQPSKSLDLIGISVADVVLLDGIDADESIDDVR